MHRFFLETITTPKAVITGSDARKITKSLRIQSGREITVCNARGTDYRCLVIKASGESVELKILESTSCTGESPMFVRVYQAMPKADKLEFAVQRAVELGVSEIVPVFTARCISRPSARAMENRRVRLQKLAKASAAKSGRGIIPTVMPAVDFDVAVEGMAQVELPVMLHGNGGVPLREVLRPGICEAALLVGSEGGFSQGEVAAAREAGIVSASLGPGVLRSETMLLCALTLLNYAAGRF